MSAPATLCLGGIGLLAVGVALAVAGRWRPALVAQALGMAAVGIGGAAVLCGGAPAGSAFGSGFAPAFGVDRLSGFFLGVLAVTAVPALVYARDALTSVRRAPVIAALTGAFCLVLAGLVTARDVTTFLASWELMTLLPAAVILVVRHDDRTRGDVFAYLAIAHLGGIGVWVAMLVLAAHGALGGTPLSDPGLRALVAVAAIVGFGTKAGAMPLHSWLPRAHPLAPAHVSALMSGVMIKLALYGLIRVLFTWAAPTPQWAGLALLAIGALSAVGGVVYALFQHELKRLLAFCSIENVGIIVLGLGASLVFASIGQPQWSAIAFAAALLHTLNHAVFKALLFLGAGSFASAAGELELDRLGGLLRAMPWTGAAFAVGAMAIAGVPPLNGFASEWMTLQSLLHVAVLGGFGVSLAGALATAALGAAAGLAVFCFVKVIGLVLLGPPRRAECAQAHETTLGRRGAVVFLAGLCVLLGAVPGLLVPLLARLGPGHAALVRGPGISLPGTGGLPALALAAGLAVVVGGLWRARAARRRTAASPVWVCGQAVEPSLAWTSTGFTKPARLILEAVLRPTREIAVRVQGGVTQEVAYDADVPHLFDTVVYEPVTSAALRGAAVVRRLQSGSLATYVVYLLALLALLLALVRFGVLT
jgi:hydrogenase-4 component B